MIIRNPILRAVLFLGMAFSSSLHAYDFRTVAEEHILTGYRQLSESTLALKHVVHGLCDKTEGVTANDARSLFRNAFKDWQSIQHIRFGPVQYLSRDYRFELWPDKRGTVSKHLAKLLQDPLLLTNEFDISEKSVAVQGFSALERILFGQPPFSQQSCRVITAITDNLNNMAVDIINDWTQGKSPFVEFFFHPGPDNPIFGSENELAGQLLNSLHTQLEFMITQKLDRPLGNEIDKARGSRAEGWRSKTALSALEHNLLATRQIYLLSFAPKLSRPLAEKIELAYQDAELTLTRIESPLKQAVSDSRQRKQVVQLRQSLSGLKRLIATNLAQELDLSLGFNSLDGD